MYPRSEPGVRLLMDITEAAVLKCLLMKCVQDTRNHFIEKAQINKIVWLVYLMLAFLQITI